MEKAPDAILEKLLQEIDTILWRKAGHLPTLHYNAIRNHAHRRAYLMRKHQPNLSGSLVAERYVINALDWDKAGRPAKNPLNIGHPQKR